MSEATSKKESKREKYIQAFEELGLDVTYTQFAAHCAEKLGMGTVPESNFYAVRSELRGKAKPKPKAPAPASQGNGNGKHRETATREPARSVAGPSVGVGELPALLEQARALLQAFGGDKEALAQFVRAL